MLTEHGYLFFIFFIILVLNTDTCHAELPNLEALNNLCEFCLQRLKHCQWPVSTLIKIVGIKSSNIDVSSGCVNQGTFLDPNDRNYECWLLCTFVCTSVFRIWNMLFILACLLWSRHLRCYSDHMLVILQLLEAQGSIYFCYSKDKCTARFLYIKEFGWWQDTLSWKKVSL